MEGDFNGDGALDLVRGEPQGYSGRGQVVVHMAGEPGDETWTQNSWGVLEFSQSGDEFGAAIVVGDFDNDGYDDLAIGVPGEDYGSLTDPGAVNVLYGSSTGLTGLGDQLWKEASNGVQGTAESGDEFGSRLSVGDFNCDGYADLVIGAPDEAIGSKDEAGAVHVLYGSAGGLSSVSDVWYQGNNGVNGGSEAGDRFGDTLVSGDFDGDSCADLVIGAPTEDWGSTVDAGNAYAIYGSSGGLTTSGDWTIVQGSIAQSVGTDDRFATRMWTEDRDSDGYDDLIVMTPGDPCGPTQKGFNYLYGGLSGLSTSGQAWFCKEYHD